MGAVPVLLVLAAVGVDYGWKPDGTTSMRGDNVEYIVQISPEQLRQTSSFGEITSTIDPSIQGRVSRIVVRVGTGELPRDAGRATPEKEFRTAKADRSADNDVLPIPEITDSLAVKSAASSRDGMQTNEATESLMKPDPQGSGFQLPDSLRNGGQTALDQVRSSVNDAAGQFESQPRATNASQPNAFGASAATASPAATANSTSRPDDRWADLTRGNASASAAGPSTDPVDSATKSSTWPRFVGPLQPSDPRSITNSNTATTNNSLVATPGSRPATDASDPNWSGYGTTQNFGATPAGINLRNDFATASQPNTSSQTALTQPNTSLLTDPRYTSAGTTPTTAQAGTQVYYDELGRPVDSESRPIDPSTVKYSYRGTQLVDPQGLRVDRYGNLVDAAGNRIGRDGSRLDTYGNPAFANTAANPSASSSTIGGDPYGTSIGYDPSKYPASNNPAMLTAAQILEQRRLEAQRLDEQNRIAYQQRLDEQRLYDAQNQRIAQRNAAGSTALVNYDEEAGSPSDVRYAGTTRSATTEQERNAAASTIRPKSVAAQPFFNFVLLISLVGNAYLIFETNNLRRKFRNMISSMRTSKVAAQPVT